MQPRDPDGCNVFAVPMMLPDLFSFTKHTGVQETLQDCEAHSLPAADDVAPDLQSMFARVRASCAKLLPAWSHASNQQPAFVDIAGPIDGNQSNGFAAHSAPVALTIKQATEVPEKSTSASADVFNLFDTHDASTDVDDRSKGAASPQESGASTTDEDNTTVGYCSPAAD